MSDPFLGEIQIFPYNYAPQGWAHCSGSIIAISDNPALYSLLADSYGGDNRTTFGLPNLQGRSVIGQGRGPGLSDARMTTMEGEEYTELLVSHTHEVSSSSVPAIPLGSGKGTQESSENGYLADGSCDVTFPAATAPANFYAGTKGSKTLQGNSLDYTIKPTPNVVVTNMQPFLVMLYCIAMQGTFPIRS